ncbi:MAG TPA: sialidase family protein, partial [Fimbriimonadaceae bacterium]|nr:sialidase family protein [Fimbriimonadaceae bacterium]
MKRIGFLSAVSLLIVAVSPGQALNGLKWRNIGPFRAGRVSAVAGVPGNPAVYYMGLPQGGVWKTTSAGQTWFPVFDAVQATSSIGSIQVAPSNPTVVYAGTGEISGGSEGAGVYRSDDGGTTWRLLGLEGTSIIPAILVDPRDANTVLVAALGEGAPSDQRGVFRSSDGGKTWAKTLYVDNEIGIQHLAWAYDRPSVVFALSQRRVPRPGPAKPGEKVPTGTDIYRSTDQGLHWEKLATTGLPEIDGRCTIAVAQGTDSQRLYLIGVFGLYRSDDGGASWRRMAADDRRIANGQGYYTSGV